LELIRILLGLQFTDVFEFQFGNIQFQVCEAPLVFRYRNRQNDDVKQYCNNND
jgi:hypothetical protein